MNQTKKVLASVFVLASSAALFCACSTNKKPEEVAKVAPTSVMFSNLTEDENENTGAGTLDDAYTVTISSNKSSTHNMIVRPEGADPEFSWTVGTVVDDTFTASAEAEISVTQNGSSLTIQGGADTGVYYVQGSAVTGDLVVYLQVTVDEYVELTGFTVNGLEKVEGQEYDYYFKTAKGTTWDVGSGISERGQNLLDGNGVPGGGLQIPQNLTYYSNFYKFSFTPEPASATNTNWVMTPADPDMFTFTGDGAWSANKAGETIITVTNSANEASVKIKLEVVDTLYPGVLKSEFDAATAYTDLDWFFDGHADDQGETSAYNLLGQWNLVMNKTTGSNGKGDDGNQKIFYLGEATRPYGIDLETRIDSSTGVTTGTPLALVWTKAVIPAGAKSIQAVIGNNNKNTTEYRIVFVKEDGTSYMLTDGWVTKDADGVGTTVTYDVPAECQGQTVAIVIESSLTAANDNAELHIKGVWLNLPVESIALRETSARVSQGSTYKLNVSFTPSKVYDSSMEYTVVAPEGAEGKVTVDDSGLISVATDAPLGDYTVNVKSKSNENATATFTLTVYGYVNVTSFAGTYMLDGTATDLDGAEFNEKQGANSYDLTLTFAPANASVQTYNVTYSQVGVASVKDGKLNFVSPGTTTVTITPVAEEASEMAISFTVTVREGTIHNWDGADAIFNGWTKVAEEGTTNYNGGGWFDSFGEGAGLRTAGSYITYDVTLDDLDTLTVGARTFARADDPNSTLYVSIIVDGEETYLYASGYDYDGEDYILIDTTIASWDSRNELVFDLSEYAGQDVTLKIENKTDGAYCCLTDIKLS